MPSALSTGHGTNWIQEDSRMKELYLRLAGLAFVFLGAGWVWAGFRVDEPLVWFTGGLTAAAGVALMSIAPRLGERERSDG